ncbi:MAG: hypothetical protein NZM12_07075 [Steroidobacteraceae bacterium]|nr:hypothetical protein [Steroidobacteraceae bacterium]MDW8258135.1 transcriptional regulator [Gammaproteobacteria bacterium]
MDKFAKKLLVVITEATLEQPIAKLALESGAHGYTVHDVHGAGSAGTREGSWEADRNIELKIICDPGVADRIAEQVFARYAGNFALTLFFADVQVLRPQKY